MPRYRNIFLRVRNLAASFSFFAVCLFSTDAIAGVKQEKMAEFLIQRWGLEDGLPQSTVNAITQTPDGYLWFGTFDGLVRFDGVRFTVFGQSPTPGLASSGVLALTVDKNERLWIGSSVPGSISLLDKGVFRTFTTSDGVPNQGRLSFFHTDRGDLSVFGSSSINLRQFDGTRFIESPENHLVNFGAIIFARDLSGGLYGFRNDHPARLEGTNWIEIPLPGGKPFATPRTATPARAGGLWLTGNDQLFRLQRESWLGTPEEIPWPHEFRAYTSLEDSTGALWIGTYGAGLWRRTANGWTRISRAEGLPQDVVRSLFEDHEGSIWVGTDGGGLARLKPKLFTNYGREDGLPENVITTVREATPGELWVGTHGGGLAIMRGKQFSKVDFPSGVTIRWVWSLAVDHTGTVWGGGAFDPRLFSFPGGNYKETPIDNVPTRESINAIVEAPDGAIWMATHRGVLRFANGVIKEFNKKDGLPSDVVRAILAAGDGVLWFGTEGGLTRYQNGKFTSFPDERLKDIQGLAASSSALWAGMGSGGGLARVQNDRVALIQKKDGLPLDHVESIIEDGLGNLWLAGNRGVCRVHLTELDAFAEGRKHSIEAFLYGQDDGLGSSECPGGHQPNVCKSSDGRLWFGTVGGLSVIDPQNVKPNTLAPKVWIEEVLIDGKPQRSALESHSSKDIVIPPGAKRFEVHYTGLSFLTPSQVLFKYRLDGFDHDWNMVGNRRVAYYQGLAPGNYRFHVSACNNHGVWNESGASLGLIVQPFLWQTTSFRGAMAGLVALGLLLAYNRRVSVLKRERQVQRDFSLRLIASQEQERKRLASEIHDSLGQNLLVIKTRAAAAVSGGDTIPFMEQMEEISKTASQAIQEVRTIAHNLRPYQLDRLGLTMAMEALAKQFASSSLSLRSEVASIDLLLPAEHEINFYRIIQESLNNIVKHSGAKNAWLEVVREQTRLVVTIGDDGCGFDFQAIIQDPLSKRGLGLTGLMERARSFDGTLQIDSTPGKGTRLILTVPLRERANHAQTIVPNPNPGTPRSTGRA